MGLGSRSPSRIVPGRVVKARQPHVCSRCGTTIPKGVLYHQVATLPYVKPERNCIKCAGKGAH